MSEDDAKEFKITEASSDCRAAYDASDAAFCRAAYDAGAVTRDYYVLKQRDVFLKLMEECK